LAKKVPGSNPREPKRARESPEGAQDTPKITQDRPRIAQDRPKMAQDKPKTAKIRLAIYDSTGQGQALQFFVSAFSLQV
jgi:hypothetical protein